MPDPNTVERWMLRPDGTYEGPMAEYEDAVPAAAFERARKERDTAQRSANRLEALLRSCEERAERAEARNAEDNWVRLTRDKEDDTVRTLERWGWFDRADWPSDRHTAKRCVALIFDSLSPTQRSDDEW